MKNRVSHLADWSEYFWSDELVRFEAREGGDRERKVIGRNSSAGRIGIISEKWWGWGLI